MAMRFELPDAFPVEFVDRLGVTVDLRERQLLVHLRRMASASRNLVSR